jgi:hypothetical protein
MTDAQVAMIMDSGPKGLGVELRGAGPWAIARNLVAREYGWIEGDPGDGLPALYFNNADGEAFAREELAEQEESDDVD